MATGLGISLDLRSAPNTPRLRRPRSFDQDSGELHILNTPVSKSRHDAALTAPLPSSRSFSPRTPASLFDHSDNDYVQRRNRRADLEGGLQSASWAPGTFEDDGRDVWAKEQRRIHRGLGFVAVLESVNAGIAFVAGKLAKMASDDVLDGAEDGLLLPVRNEEREGRGTMID